MENRISQYENEVRRSDNHRGDPQPIAAILAELLAQYQTRFPDAKIIVMETTATAI